MRLDKTLQLTTSNAYQGLIASELVAQCKSTWYQFCIAEACSGCLLYTHCSLLFYSWPGWLVSVHCAGRQLSPPNHWRQSNHTHYTSCTRCNCLQTGRPLPAHSARTAHCKQLLPLRAYRDTGRQQRLWHGLQMQLHSWSMACIKAAADG